MDIVAKEWRVRHPLSRTYPAPRQGFASAARPHCSLHSDSKGTRKQARSGMRGRRRLHLQCPDATCQDLQLPRLVEDSYKVAWRFL